MDPYSHYKKLQATKCHKRDIKSLVKGKLYTLTELQVKQSIFETEGQKPMNMIAHFDDTGLKFFVYMPKEFNDPDLGMVKEINDHIKNGKPGAICFYGCLGSKYVVEIHAYGTEVDKERFNTIEAMEAACSSPQTTKRKVESNEKGDSPKKALK